MKLMLHPLMTHILTYYQSSAKIGLGRDLTAYFTSKIY